MCEARRATCRTRTTLAGGTLSDVDGVGSNIPQLIELNKPFGQRIALTLLSSSGLTCPDNRVIPEIIEGEHNKNVDVT